MTEVQKTEMWLKTIFNINKEIDFEREQARVSLLRAEDLEKQKEEIFKLIAAIENPTYKAVLHKRYVQGKKWEEISQELHYEYPHVHRLHKKAVAEVCKIKKGQK